MIQPLSDREWEILLERIKAQRCVPFLGAGASYGALPLGAEIARELAEKYQYPLEDRDDLIRVAQYIAVEYGDSLYPKELILKRFAGAKPPDFSQPDEPHGVLAELPLSVYMTTNYDDFMFQALKNRYKDPRREFCRWNDALKNRPSAFDARPRYQPSPANPLVYQLHGHTDPHSLVLTEDDYLLFLDAMRDPKLLPAAVRTALSESSLLFIGYRLADWNIRVLLQGLRRGLLRNLSVMVLVPPRNEDPERQRKVQDYLDRYYAMQDLRVYWGTVRTFCAELRRRWEASTQ